MVLGKKNKKTKNQQSLAMMSHGSIGSERELKILQHKTLEMVNLLCCAQ